MESKQLKKRFYGRELETFVSNYRNVLKLKNIEKITTDWLMRVSKKYSIVKFNNSSFLLSQISTFERKPGQFKVKENELEKTNILLGTLEWMAIRPENNTRNMRFRKDPNIGILLMPEQLNQAVLEEHILEHEIFAKITTPEIISMKLGYTQLYKESFEYEQRSQQLGEFVDGTILI